MSKEIYNNSFFNFYIDKILGKAWGHFKDNWSTLILSVMATSASFLGVFAVYALMLGLVNSSYFPAWSFFVLSAILVIALVALLTIISAGWIKLVLNIVDHDKAKVGDLFLEYKKIFSFFTVMFLYSAMVIAGIMFFIIPGIVLGLMFMWAPILVVDKNMGPIEALSKSKELTNGAKWDLFLVKIVESGGSYISGISIIGIVVAVPLITISKILMYRHVQR
ncbi:hypothetical protein COY25_00160 [Candidatus Uhrbacteria bacterium CG_4_10_14_0_2_um_filter_41_7]|uniref:Glycerophosphoryl diester phosphodiesterase membrane domain-containing protein n=1 Tax=Candidatus Uhrbacteria bacterium CG_4_9_14_3_um_filter_41_35 TaxID=1975034 RepID=A0A2M7XG23_9BACT|nr:MAG: hypothetical protein COV92_03860 [Candidatus Uhrbacteria bacterium CG11_big_fil_rev_8_21_14_0_20_41_9]PIZ55834.1 MAG: hypothetical protein COY25_00160 [Candidatus Uhrbacteria bacterium CG_4_10_14_0_2_um_filter_41_7]PJA46809.1 MAG: hypothetical protein CO173_01120 [Candidatus Uhrbacteria bacterium CG_4_9_14_3_um_filter_41_35]